ncbi:cation diffusion facilitator family transporter [Oryzifoliimicrobium ureilyticus]|uniref:cation diffusion facilitator family transporter n=1 Tax=Oryzifoliimicrobium ureilyticus TaxID=3113724 RepID=UPI0030761450
MDAAGNRNVRRLALIGIPVAFAVMGLKLVAWWVTGSVALLSDALESSVNVVAAFMALFVVHYAQRPADHDHPYGHHKAEYLSAVTEGVLIVVAALLIVKEALPEVFNPRLLDAPVLGLAINMGAAVVNGIWAKILINAGSKYRSAALKADGQHIMSDVVTSVGVLIGLVLAILTGYAIFDPLLAVVVAGNILYQGAKVITHSVGGLMDQAVSSEEEEAIKTVISANAPGALGVHDLKTRQAGAATFVSFHLVVPATMAVSAAHDICDRLEYAIQEVHPGSHVTIHVEPEGEKAHGLRVKTVKEA